MQVEFYIKNREVHLNYFRKIPLSPPGTAARILNNQIKQFKKIGIEKITLDASGNYED
jgi:hypothetical protein